MGGTRTLIASLGASAVLVATGALSLLALSVVFAFGGWSGPLSQSADKPALVFADPNVPGAGAPGGNGGQVIATGEKRIVVPASAAGAARRDAGSADAIGPRVRRAPGRPKTSVPPDGGTSPPNPNPIPPTPPAVEAPPPAAPQPSAAVAEPRTGDHVRQIGTSLSSTLEQTGSTLAAVTLPLAPPVSAALQTVLNLVADVARRATDGLGTVLDVLLPRRERRGPAPRAGPATPRRVARR